MSSQLLRQVGIVSESKAVPPDQVARIAAAIQKQVQRDFAPVWSISATVAAFARLEDVPLGTWPILIQDDIGYYAAGIHQDHDGQPFALVESSTEDGVVSLTTSHECLEMLADPFGKHLVPGDSPKPDQNRVVFLVEVCDPSEAASYAYTVDGELVSDFYTPSFFEPVAAPGVRYSFTGAIQEPRSVLQGGYLSWMVPETRDWWQEIWFGTPQSTFKKLGPIDDSSRALRTELDRVTGPDRANAIKPGRSAALLGGSRLKRVSIATGARAHDLRTRIEEIHAEAKLTRVDGDGPARPNPADTHRRSAPRI
ncbi:MAG TPA: hypothetical protein VMR50_10520 [Myxococcota bacterium]|nr:hypothetical protein [Myxococcota bacterium]